MFAKARVTLCFFYNIFSHKTISIHQFLEDEEKIHHIAWDMARANKRDGSVLQRLEEFGSAFVEVVFHSRRYLSWSSISFMHIVVSISCTNSLKEYVLK